MRRKKRKDDGFKPCWNYYHCSKECMKDCPAYQNGFYMNQFSDCWFYVTDAIQGGPGKHGPCAYCDWNHKHGFFKNWSSKKINMEKKNVC